MPSLDKDYAVEFIKQNLKKGYTINALMSLLERRGVKTAVIQQAVKEVNPVEFQQDAVNFVSQLLDKQLQKGAASDTLISSMEAQGIDPKIISSALQSLKQETTPKPLPVKPSFHPHVTKTTWIALLSIVGGVILAGVILSLLYRESPAIAVSGLADCRFDKSCFAEFASQCKTSLVREDIDGSMLIYKSFADCSITKEFESFGSKEPEEVITFFEGKFMRCTTEKGTSPVESLVSGLEQCSGPLKDAIYELEYAARQLET